MFGSFNRKREDEQKRRREIEDRARRVAYENDTSGAGGGYAWPLGVSGAGGYTPHVADASTRSANGGSSL